MPDIVRDDWRFIPSEAVDAEKRQDDAQAWGDDQRQQLAQRWGDAQRAAAPPLPLAGDPSVAPPPGAESLGYLANKAYSDIWNSQGMTPGGAFQSNGVYTPGQQDATVRQLPYYRPGSGPNGPQPPFGPVGRGPANDVYAENISAGLPQVADAVDRVQQQSRQLATPPSKEQVAPEVDPSQNQFSPYDHVFKKYAGDLSENPEFVSIVAAGTLAESGWNAGNTTGDGGHSWGLFQMHDQGAGAGMGNSRLDPDAASAKMVPLYAAAYQQIKAQNPNLTGPALAARVAQAAERSADPSGRAYANAFQQIAGNASGLISSAGQFFGQKVDEAKSAIQNLGQTNQSGPPIQGDYTSALPGGTQNPVVAGSQALSDITSQVPILGGPSVLEQAQTYGDIQSKYGGGIQNGKFRAPDYSNITPEDQEKLSQSTAAVGGIVGGDISPSFASRAQPEGAMGFPSRSDQLASREVRDQAIQAAQRGFGIDPDVAAPAGGILQPASAAERASVQAQLDQQTAGNYPGIFGDRVTSAMKRLDAGDESALDDLQKIDKEQSTQAPTAQPAERFDAQGNQVSSAQGAPSAYNQATAAPVGSPGGGGLPTAPPGQPPTGVPPVLPGPAPGGVPPRPPVGGAGQPPVTPPGAPPTGGGAPPVPPGGGPPVPPAVPAGFNNIGVTQDMIDVAHARIDKAIDIGQFPQQNAAAHAQLDQMLQSNTGAGDIGRFLFNDVEKNKIPWTDKLRTLRTGSMAGGATTEDKVLLSPIVQAAFRGPEAAIRSIVTGKAADIPKGLIGAASGFTEGLALAGQQVRYGVTMPQALTGGEGGFYGFRPGIDVMAKTGWGRALGTAGIGLVRTHGAISEISAGIGRGAARATGSTEAESQQIGQEWALRARPNGTIGRAVSDFLTGMRSQNPAFNVVGQVLMPFWTVSYNVLTQGMERSVVGLTGTALDVARSKLPTSAPSYLGGPYAQGATQASATPVAARLTRNISGTVGLSTLGLYLASQGFLTGEHPQDPGAPKWSLRTPAGWVPLRTAPPVTEALAQSATLYESIRDGNGNIPEIANRVASTYAKHMEDETWLRSVLGMASAALEFGQQFSGSRSQQQAAQRGIRRYGTDLAQSFVPQYKLGSQAAQKTGEIAQGMQAPAPAPVAPGGSRYRSRP